MVEAVDVGVVPLLRGETRQRPDPVIKTQAIDGRLGHLSFGLGFVLTMSHLKVEAQHQGERPEAAARADLLRVNRLLRIDRPQLLHLLQLEQQDGVTQINTTDDRNRRAPLPLTHLMVMMKTADPMGPE